MWERAQDEAYEKTKEALVSSHVLGHYDLDQQLMLECDAFPYGVGGELSHQMEDGSSKAIVFASHILTPMERKYAELDNEAPVIVFGVKRFPCQRSYQGFHYQGNHTAVKESCLVPNFPVTNQDSDSKGSNDI